MRGHGDLGRIEWPGEDEGVNFHLPHGEMIRILRANGFEIEALHERLAPASIEDHDYYDFMPAAWAQRWPAEEVWVARKAV